MLENRNTILAIILSGLVLIAWQYFYNGPQMAQQAAQQRQAQLVKRAQPKTAPTQPKATQSETTQSETRPSSTPSSAPPAGPAPSVDHSASNAVVVSRAAALARTPRVKVDTPTLSGSISLKGARVDDLKLVKFHKTVDPSSPDIVLYSPSGSVHPYYAEFGWVAAAGSTVRVPNEQTMWQQVGTGSLTPSTPIVLKWDNGQGLTFRRTISVDSHYMFTIKDDVINAGNVPVTLYPYALISRHGTPKVLGYYLLHEGLIGYLGKDGLQEYTYKKINSDKSVSWKVTDGWLGFTDKYWASALVPNIHAQLDARFSSQLVDNVHVYQADYLENPQTIAAGGTGSVSTRLFAGAKQADVVGLNFPIAGFGGYNKQLSLNHFDLMIDWGWFYFITKPMFLALDFFAHLTGNFGISILLVTVLLKLLFFPLANKSYASMAKMKAAQPQLQALKERYPDDKVKQQQEMMAIYKKEKINPIAGCLPMALLIPVFYALYKVLFVTIEMRHAPFFGWIRDLSAPDPTNLFTLFGVLHYDPTQVPIIGHYLVLGIWPIIMGITMWFQMKLNPAPPDPTQKLIFDWMPVIFTFMLAQFPAGLVIYYAWNNLLSVAQQSFIMHRNGVKVELFNNLKATFLPKKAESKLLASPFMRRLRGE